MAGLVPAVLSYIVFQGWGLLHVEGAPTLGIVSSQFAVGGGILAYLMRYLRHRQTFEAFAELAGVAVLGVILIQYAEADHTIWSLALKWLGLLFFLALNVVLIVDVLAVAVNPYLVRADERRAAGN